MLASIPSAAEPHPSNGAAASASADLARKPSPSKHIPALDGLRGLAILLVLIFHFSKDAYGHLPVEVKNIVGAGWIGVDLFFVLSGFLITSILYEAKGSAGYFKNFYMRRLLRIFPLYYGVLIVAALAGVLFFDRLSQNYQRIVHSQWGLWLYLQNFMSVNWLTFAHFWSLAVEEHYYLVWPTVVFLFNRKAAMAICIGLIATAIAVRFGRVAHGQDIEATYTWTICRMDSLSLGSLLALAVSGLPAGVERFRSAALITLPLVALTCALMLLRNGSFYYGHRTIQQFGYTVVGIGSAALLVLAVTSGGKGLFGVVFSNFALRFLGKYSYGIYVFHGFIVVLFAEIIPARNLAPRLGGSYLAAVILTIVVGAVASIGIALLSWHSYEKHFLKLKRFFEYRAPTIDGFKANESVAAAN